MCHHQRPSVQEKPPSQSFYRLNSGWLLHPSPPQDPKEKKALGRSEVRRNIHEEDRNQRGFLRKIKAPALDGEAKVDVAVDEEEGGYEWHSWPPHGS